MSVTDQCRKVDQLNDLVQVMLNVALQEIKAAGEIGRAHV